MKTFKLVCCVIKIKVTSRVTRGHNGMTLSLACLIHKKSSYQMRLEEGDDDGKEDSGDDEEEVGVSRKILFSLLYMC